MKTFGLGRELFVLLFGVISVLFALGVDRPYIFHTTLLVLGASESSLTLDFAHAIAYTLAPVLNVNPASILITDDSRPHQLGLQVVVVDMSVTVESKKIIAGEEYKLLHKLQDYVADSKSSQRLERELQTLGITHKMPITFGGIGTASLEGGPNDVNLAFELDRKDSKHGKHLFWKSWKIISAFLLVLVLLALVFLCIKAKQIVPKKGKGV